MTYSSAREICFELKPMLFDSEIKFLEFVFEDKLYFKLRIRIQTQQIERIFTSVEFELMDEQIFKLIVEQTIKKTLNQK